MIDPKQVLRSALGQVAKEHLAVWTFTPAEAEAVRQLGPEVGKKVEAVRRALVALACPLTDDVTGAASHLQAHPEHPRPRSRVAKLFFWLLGER